MRIHFFPVIFCLAIFIILSPSIAEKTQQTASIPPLIDQILNKTQQWRNYNIKFDQTRIEFSVPMLIAGVLSFLAASISSAGGIGGGGLYVPIMTIVAGLDLKTASSFSAFMVTGGSVANVGCNLFAKSLKTQIDFDLALLLEPCMLLGVSVGVICNVVFPNWLVTILFAVFLAWSTIKTCQNGIYYWGLESEMGNVYGSDDIETRNDDMKGEKEPLLLGMDREHKRSKRFPLMKLGVLMIVWFSFFAIYLVRGNKHGEGVISIEPCGVAYWVLSSLQIPLALVFTLWICSSDRLQHQLPEHQESEKDVEDLTATSHGGAKKCMFPIMSLLAGMLGGVFGIGGGMLISPLLLQVGITPEVTAATCSFMVLFSSTMSAIQYLLLGMEHTEAASIFAVICFMASLLGLMVVQRVIEKYGRASIIVFSVGIVMALSTVLMTSYGAIDVWKDYESGSYMGFKLPC